MMGLRAMLVSIVLVATFQVGYGELKPTVSIVDYLKSTGQPSDFASRKESYELTHPDDKYTGSESQNTRWLIELAAKDSNAAEVATQSQTHAVETVTQNFADRPSMITKQVACPSYVLSKGFGILGSYGFDVRLAASNGEIKDRDIWVTLGAAHLVKLGKVKLTARGEFFVMGETEPFASSCPFCVRLSFTGFAVP